MDFFLKDKKYVLSLATGQYENAKQYLQENICASGEGMSPAIVAGLAQQLGKILLKQGDRPAAIILHELSQKLDPGSLLVKLDYAKFLAMDLHNKSAAISKAQEIIDTAKAKPFARSTEDFGSEEYIAAAKQIISDCAN